MGEETVFYKKADEWLYRMLELNPVTATQMGEHRWDDMLADNSAQALEHQYRETGDFLRQFEAMDAKSFERDARIDHTLIVQILKSFVRQYERVESHRRDPGYYIGEVMSGVFMLIMKEFAPLPDRLGSVVGRLRQAPGVLEAARANLAPADVPAVWAEVALQQAKHAPALFMAFLPGLAAQHAPKMERELKEVGETAAQAAQTFADFVEKDVLPKAKGDFAVGRELFDEMLRENHMVDYDADELLDTGWRLFGETEDAMQAAARRIDPERSMQDLLEEAKAEHPTADGLLAAYEDAMQAARRYVIEEEIATIPPGETLRIIETPAYLRPLLPYAAYMPPGTLEEAQEGLFLVTPVDPDSPPEVQEEKLKGQNFAKLPITALHEAYPGHHLQLVRANLLGSIPRRLGMFVSTLFIEGWAFYCEELMEQLGFIGSPVQRLWRLTDQLWRAARIVLDVSLHTRGMTVQEAVDFLVEKCQLEPSNALAEVRRYTTSPTQPQSYLMGKLAILDLVEEFRRARPGMTMREMHDAILDCGSLPPKLMRECLLGTTY
jgi:uncharacterized protein (DUF885 family)